MNNTAVYSAEPLRHLSSKNQAVNRCVRKVIASVAFLWTTATGLGLLAEDFQGAHHVTEYESEPFSYTRNQPNDDVSRLNQRLENGEAPLEFDAKYGYLPDLLKRLQIVPSSQTLVFSKTSLHREFISPEHPRAIFFNDDVYVGWTPSAPMLEIASTDPKRGAIFYVLAQTRESKQRITRNQSCLECHVSAKTMGMPGHLLRSFEVDSSGRPIESTGNIRVTHDTQWNDRWGGWYVTGSQGLMTNRGNLFGASAFSRHAKDSRFRSNLLSLDEFFPKKSYPSSGSDIVALMVLEHQVHLHNFLARLQFESVSHLARYGHIRYLNSPIESFLQYLLFTEEPVLTSPVRGLSGFREHFETQGPLDSKGRSLRKMNLQHRLFEYPCSYLIYSEAFEALPSVVKTKLYQRLAEILEGHDDSPPYTRLSAIERTNVLEILRETKKGFATAIQRNFEPSN